jgi:glycosyltransferase involved in cell wall biosynthesis
MFKVLVVGTSQRKNINRIYSIVSKLKDITFIFVGHYDNVLDLNNLIIKPNISDTDLQNLYKTSNLLLFPSLTEGFGLPILEAQYFDLPVITSNKEPMRSVAGINGALLVNPLSEDEIISAIFEIKFNKKKVSQMIDSGRENIKKYQINNIVNKYSMVYNLIKL